MALLYKIFNLYFVHMQPHEEISFESNKNENSQRQTYVVISIPGLNQWAKEKGAEVEQSNTNVTDNNSTGKRSLNDRNDNDTVEMDCSEPITKKEKVLEDTTDTNMSDSDCSTNVQSIVSKDHILNFPIPIDGGKACIVKVC